jgi:hypothetical protein
MAFGQGICGSASGVDACHNLALSSYSCVWLNGQCTFDPCALITNMTQCVQQAGPQNCLPGPWMSAQSVQSCISYEFLCNRISLEVCTTVSMCSIKSASYCGYAIPKGTGSAGQSIAECSTFPLWSIALLVLWLFIMMILIAIIVLALKRRNQSITGVESGKVDIDNVAIRDDNFAPLARNVH